MKRKSIFTYRKRLFLNPASTDLTSYTHATLNPLGTAITGTAQTFITIANCKRQIRLEFFLGEREIDG